MSEHECACNDKKKFDWWSMFYFFMVIAMAGVIVSGMTDNCDKKAANQAKQIKQLEDNYINVIAYQMSMNKVFANITTILSNQTQMLIALKNVAEIQMMSSSSPSEFNFDLPAMEEMQPSSTNGIDLSGVDLFEPSLLEAIKNHPYSMLYWGLIP